jgi:4-amino-4-deoxy-L-arabinose transferase-like glycosyltransferase
MGSGRRRIVLAATCVAVRAAYAVFIETAPTDVYTWELASDLLHPGGSILDGLPSSDYEPLHPLFLAAARWLTGDRIWAVLGVQFCVAALTTVLLDRLATRIMGTPTAGLVAASAYILAPYLVRQSTGWLEITLLNFLLVGAWYAWSRERSVQSVLWLALATLTRSIVFPVAVLAVGLTWWRDQRRGIAAALVCLALVGPWAARNVAEAGVPWPSRQAQIFYNGNNPLAAAMVPDHDMDLFSLKVTPDESYEDTMAQAWAYIRARPAHFAWTKMRNFVYFFSPQLIPRYPVDEHSELLVHGDGRIETRNPRVRPRLAVVVQESFAALLLGAAAMGAWRSRGRQRGSEMALLWATIMTFALTAAVYYPTTRLRTAVDPAFMVLAAGLVAARRDRDAG